MTILGNRESFVRARERESERERERERRERERELSPRKVYLYIDFSLGDVFFVHATLEYTLLRNLLQKLQINDEKNPMNPNIFRTLQIVVPAN